MESRFTIPGRFTFQNATKAELEKSELILLKGELAIESDTTKMKVGDGVNLYKDLPYIKIGENITYTKSEVDNLIKKTVVSLEPPDLSGYATKKSLESYYTKEEVDGLITLFKYYLAGIDYIKISDDEEKEISKIIEIFIKKIIKYQEIMGKFEEDYGVDPIYTQDYLDELDSQVRYLNSYLLNYEERLKAIEYLKNQNEVLNMSVKDLYIEQILLLGDIVHEKESMLAYKVDKARGRISLNTLFELTIYVVKGDFYKREQKKVLEKKSEEELSELLFSYKTDFKTTLENIDNAIKRIDDMLNENQN